MRLDCALVVGLLILPTITGCSRHLSPATQPTARSTPPGLSARDLAVLESALRDELRLAPANSTAFIAVETRGTGRMDPPPGFLERFSDLPYKFKPASMASKPESEEVESLVRFRVHDPATGEPAAIYWASIEAWLVGGRVRVEVGAYSGPLAARGRTCIYELRDGVWIFKETEGSWVS